jgi:hypothetical protein
MTENHNDKVLDWTPEKNLYDSEVMQNSVSTAHIMRGLVMRFNGENTQKTYSVLDDLELTPLQVLDTIYVLQSWVHFYKSDEKDLLETDKNAIRLLLRYICRDDTIQLQRKYELDEIQSDDNKKNIISLLTALSQKVSEQKNPKENLLFFAKLLDDFRNKENITKSNLIDAYDYLVEYFYLNTKSKGQNKEHQLAKFKKLYDLLFLIPQYFLIREIN